MSEQKNRLLMPIGEVAKTLQITRRMILNYEQKGLIAPDKKDGANGNRYYTPDSITRIKTIRTLQDLGCSLDEIRSYYDGTLNLDAVLCRLTHLRDELNHNIEELKTRILENDTHNVKTIILPSQTVYCETVHASTLDERKDRLREVTMRALHQYRPDSGKPMLFTEQTLTAPDTLSCFISVSPESSGDCIRLIAEERALCISCHGDYPKLRAVRDFLLSYTEENGIAHKGICRHVYLEGPPHHTDPERFITQVALLLV